MKSIQFKVTYGAGNRYLVTVAARDINSGFRKVTKEVLSALDPDYDIHSIEFWMVRDKFEGNVVTVAPAAG